MKTALITGGSTGIGYATAELFIKKGYRVVITGRSKARVDLATTKLGDSAIGFKVDHSTLIENRKVADFCKKTLGGLDTLVCNAGVWSESFCASVSEEDFDHEFNINLKGPFFLMQYCLPIMKPASSIVAITSVNDIKGIAGQIVYSSTKAALRSVVRTLSAELADKGIRVNGVAPGPIDTPIFDKAANDKATAEDLKGYEEKIPVMKRLGMPHEIASVISFLASEEASYITGADIRVDGGWGDL